MVKCTKSKSKVQKLPWKMEATVLTWKLHYYLEKYICEG